MSETHWTTYHVHILKDALVAEIRRLGARKVLKDWTGTDDEAVAAVMAEPFECINLAPGCDNRDESGRCAGHKKIVEARNAR